MKTLIQGLILALVVATNPQQVVAQGVADLSTGVIHDRSYQMEEAGVRIPYALYVPTTYRPNQPSALIVALHGLGSNPSQIMRYQGLAGLAEERGYIVVAPMGFNERGWYGSRGPGTGTSRLDRPDDPDNLGALSEQDVLNVLQLVKAEYSIDPDRIFLMGHSMGGGGTWHLATRYPDRWAALAPVAPAIYTSPDALQSFSDVPVIVIMGDEDELVDVRVTRRWVDRMESLGMNYRYIEIPGGDHTRIIARTPENMEQIFDFFDAVATASAN